MSDNIQVILVEPGMSPVLVTTDSHHDSLHKLVEGYMETSITPDGLVWVWDEDAEFKDKRENMCYPGTRVILKGKIFISRMAGGNFSSVKTGDLKMFTRKYWNKLKVWVDEV
jgi:hypothetical protein